MNEFDVMTSAAAGMDVQRAALDVAAHNVAAAEATSGPGGFERLIPRFAVAADSVRGEPDAYEPPENPSDAAGPETDALPVRYLGTSSERGVDVDAVTEMVSVLDAQRAYEANASVFDLGKRLAEKTIDVGRLE